MRPLLVSLLLLLLAGAGVAPLLAPPQWEVEAAITVAAPPAQVYALVATPRTWQQWSSWNPTTDPTARFTYEGPETGPGATARWAGQRLERGTFRIETGAPEQGVTYTLTIDGAPPVHGTMRFTPAGTGTCITWRDRGDVGTSYLGRALRLVLPSLLRRVFSDSLDGLNKRLAADARESATPASRPH